MTTHLPRLAGRFYHCRCGSPVFSGTATAELDAVQGWMRYKGRPNANFKALYHLWLIIQVYIGLEP
jgi:hypothetical protein